LGIGPHSSSNFTFTFHINQSTTGLCRNYDIEYVQYIPDDFQKLHSSSPDHRLPIPQISRKSIHNFLKDILLKTNRQTGMKTSLLPSCGAGQDIQQSEFVAFPHVLTILKVIKILLEACYFLYMYDSAAKHHSWLYGGGATDIGTCSGR